MWTSNDADCFVFRDWRLALPVTQAITTVDGSGRSDSVETLINDPRIVLQINRVRIAVAEFHQLTNPKANVTAFTEFDGGISFIRSMAIPFIDVTLTNEGCANFGWSERPHSRSHTADHRTHEGAQQDYRERRIPVAQHHAVCHKGAHLWQTVPSWKRMGLPLHLQLAEGR
jgi:hypothetical protein